MWTISINISNVIFYIQFIENTVLKEDIDYNEQVLLLSRYFKTSSGCGKGLRLIAQWNGFNNRGSGKEVFVPR